MGGATRSPKPEIQMAHSKLADLLGFPQAEKAEKPKAKISHKVQMPSQARRFEAYFPCPESDWAGDTRESIAY